MLSWKFRSTTEDKDALERQKQSIAAHIQTRTTALTKKLTIQSIKLSKRDDTPEAEAEVVDIPTARYVHFVDLTSPPRQKPRWSPENHIRPQKLQSNSLLNVFQNSSVKRASVQPGPRINGIHFQTVQELTRLIRENPDNQCLDPSDCECPNCPYSTGCLATQRFVLLQRFYQIDNVFKDRPELYGRDLYTDES